MGKTNARELPLDIMLHLCSEVYALQKTHYYVCLLLSLSCTLVELNVENIASLQSPGSLIPNLDSHFPAAFCVVLFSNSVLSDLSITVLRLCQGSLEMGCVWSQGESGHVAGAELWSCHLLLSLAGSHVAGQSMGIWKLLATELGGSGNSSKDRHVISDAAKNPKCQLPRVLARSHPAADTISGLAYLLSTRTQDSLVLGRPRSGLAHKSF